MIVWQSPVDWFTKGFPAKYHLGDEDWREARSGWVISSGLLGLSLLPPWLATPVSPQPQDFCPLPCLGVASYGLKPLQTGPK